jgi:acyl dehydratase
MLYAVGVGAGQEDPSRELAFTTENSYGLRQRVLPTFATVVGNASIPPVGEVALETLIHGVQGVAVHNELPVRGKARLATTVTGIHDKGAAALVALETVVRDAVTDLHYATLRSSIFIQGAGGWGGDRGESSPWDAPEREPDAVRSYQTSQGQALLYRLSGDRNPLHSDPNAAVAAGFTRPILHGLCTYGYAGRALLDAVCDGDPGRFGSLSARFAAPVYPGQRLTVTMWMTRDGAMFIAVSEAGLVLDRGVFEFAAGAGTR